MTAEVSINTPQQIDAGAVYPSKITAENKSVNKQSKKEALMAMISEELISSIIGDDDCFESDDDDAILQGFQEKLAKREAARKKMKRKKMLKKKKRMLEQQQQLLPQDAVDASHPHFAQVPGQRTGSDMLGDYQVELNDDDSFAGGCLDDLMPPSSRRSTSLGSKGSYKASESVTTESCSTESASVTSGSMSVDEIRNFVLANIPKEVRDQIPQEAWGQIFQGTSGASKASSKKSSGSSKTSKQSAPVDAVASYSDDEVSVISDVTGFANAFPDGKRVESKFHTMDYENKALARSMSTESSYCTTSDRESIMDQSNGGVGVAAVPTPNGPIVKKVAFGNVTLRCYERILTDNPAVQSGPAIGIGWRYKRSGHFDVDEFEQGRGHPRSSDELVLPRPVREKMLKDAGFDQKEIADMVRTILKAKNQRKQTVHNLNAQGMEEAVENARSR
ncbi:MAG: hypothetical protein SGILL_007285, partial [Bacillariaceae sp.]